MVNQHIEVFNIINTTGKITNRDHNFWSNIKYFERSWDGIFRQKKIADIIVLVFAIVLVLAKKISIFSIIKKRYCEIQSPNS